MNVTMVDTVRHNYSYEDVLYGRGIGLFGLCRWDLGACTWHEDDLFGDRESSMFDFGVRWHRTWSGVGTYLGYVE